MRACPLFRGPLACRTSVRPVDLLTWGQSSSASGWQQGGTTRQGCDALKCNPGLEDLNPLAAVSS